MTSAARPGGLARAGAVTFGGAIFGAAVTFVMTGLIGNGLGTAGTGLFFQATAIFAIAANILQLGADTTLVRSMSRELALDRRSLLVPTAVIAIVPVMIVSVLAAIALLLSAPALAAFLVPEDAESAEAVYSALAAFLPAASLLAVVLGGSRGLGNVVAYTGLQNVGLPLIRIALVAAALSLVADFPRTALAWVVPTLPVMIVAVIVFAMLLRRSRRDDAGAAARSDWSRGTIGPTARQFWSFSLPRGGAAVLERAIDWSDVLIVVAVRGPAEGGVYAVVTRCVAVGYLLETAARIVTGPRISRALALDDLPGARRLFIGVTRVLIAVSWPFYLLLAVFSPVVLSFFGPGFADGAVALSIICGAMMISTSVGMVQSVLLMGGKSHWQLMNRFVQWGVLVVGSLLLVPPLGILGAAIAWICAILLDTILASTQVGLRMGVASSPRVVALPGVLALVIFGGGGLLLRSTLGDTLVALLTALVALGLCYLVTCYLLRGPLGLEGIMPFGRR